MLPVVFVVGCLVVVLRGVSAVVHPTLWAEDGTFWFSNAYNYGRTATLFDAHSGYLQVFPRLIADLGTFLPLRAVPAFFVLVSLAVQVLPAVLMVSRRFDRVVPDYRVRILLAAIYLLIPNSFEVSVNLTNAQWHLALLAVMVVLAVPATGAWRIFDIACVVASGLSGPFDLCLAVIVVLVYWRRRQRWTLVLAVAVAVTGAAELATLARATRGHFAPLGASVTRLVEIVGGRVIGNTVLGTATTQSTGFFRHLLLFSWFLFAAAGAVVIVAVLRGPFELKMFNLYAGLQLAGSLASPVASLIRPQWQVLAGESGLRYWLLPALAFLVDVVWLLGRLDLSRRLALLVVAAVVAAFVALGVREDFVNPVFAVPSWPAQVEQFDRAPAGHNFLFIIRPPGWTMVLNKK